MKAKIRFILTILGVICMIVAVLVGGILVHNAGANQRAAQQYCNEFNMDLQYFSAETYTIICVSENAKLTTSWK